MLIFFGQIYIKNFVRNNLINCYFQKNNRLFEKSILFSNNVKYNYIY
jgi:hypothetical protein